MDFDGLNPEKEKKALKQEIERILDGYALTSCLSMKPDKKGVLRNILHEQNYSWGGLALYVDSLDPYGQYVLLRRVLYEEQRERIWPYLSEETDLAYEYYLKPPIMSFLPEALRRRDLWDIAELSEDALKKWISDRVADALIKDDKTIISAVRRVLKDAGRFNIVEMPAVLTEKAALKKAEKAVIKELVKILQDEEASFLIHRRSIANLIQAHLAKGEPLNIQELLPLLEKEVAEARRS